jgi:hypothetical protein
MSCRHFPQISTKPCNVFTLNHNFLSPVSSHFNFSKFHKVYKFTSKNVHQSQCSHLSMNENFYLRYFDVNNQSLSFDWVLLLQVLYIYFRYLKIVERNSVSNLTNRKFKV